MSLTLQRRLDNPNDTTVATSSEDTEISGHDLGGEQQLGVGEHVNTNGGHSVAGSTSMADSATNKLSELMSTTTVYETAAVDQTAETTTSGKKNKKNRVKFV